MTCLLILKYLYDNSTMVNKLHGYLTYSILQNKAQQGRIGVTGSEGHGPQ